MLFLLFFFIPVKGSVTLGNSSQCMPPQERHRIYQLIHVVKILLTEFFFLYLFILLLFSLTCAKSPKLVLFELFLF